jgi:hypothetical protein
MDDARKTPVPSIPFDGPITSPGHKRKRGSIIKARDIAARLKVCPMEFLCGLLKSDVYVETYIDPLTGKKSKVERVIDLQTRIDVAKSVASYLFPRLQSQALVGPDGNGPVEVAAVSITQLMQNPAAVEAAQKLAIAMCEPTPARPQLPALDPAQPSDPTLDLQRNSSGHYSR